MLYKDEHAAPPPRETAEHTAPPPRETAEHAAPLPREAKAGARHFACNLFVVTVDRLFLSDYKVGSKVWLNRLQFHASPAVKQKTLRSNVTNLLSHRHLRLTRTPSPRENEKLKVKVKISEESKTKNSRRSKQKITGGRQVKQQRFKGGGTVPLSSGALPPPCLPHGRSSCMLCLFPRPPPRPFSVVCSPIPVVRSALTPS